MAGILDVLALRARPEEEEQGGGGAFAPVTGTIERPAAAPPGSVPFIAPASSAPPALSQPATQPAATQKPAAEDFDPEVGRRVAEESAEAARNTSPEEKKKVNEAMEQTFGPGAIEEAYSQVLERLQAGRPKREGTEDEGRFSFQKMDKEDMGLFMMDFGLRLMAHSGQGESLGGALGMAGSAAIEGAAGRQGAAYERAERKRLEDLEQQRHDESTAMDIVQMGQESGRAKENILRTEQGYFNTATGQYVTDPEGNVLKPYNQYGALGGAGGRASAKTEFAQRLVNLGWNPEAAYAVASGARHPYRVAEDAARMWDQLEAKGEMDRYQLPDGTVVRARQATPEQRAAARSAFVNRSRQTYEEMLRQGGGSAGGALGDMPPPDEDVPDYEDDSEFDL